VKKTLIQFITIITNLSFLWRGLGS